MGDSACRDRQPRQRQVFVSITAEGEVQEKDNKGQLLEDQSGEQKKSRERVIGRKRCDDDVYERRVTALFL